MVHNGFVVWAAAPAVERLHGFPELWYSWRHQMPALAEAGFHAIALDMRGYGESEAPVGIENYTSFHVVGDIIGVLDALGDKTGTFISDTHSKPKILSLKFRLKK
jgi:alpha-beta hydrolase superfamily lysophospholipase